MQETKLSDEAAPVMPFAMAGYELAHHGEGRWNGVAIASRVGIADVVTNFGDGPVVGVPGAAAGAGPGADDAPDDGLGPEARMIAARCGGILVVSIYAPNGRALDTPFYDAKLAWFERLSRWLEETQDPNDAILIGGDFNVAPEDLDVYDPLAYVGATHVSPAERAALARLRDWGLVDVVRPFHPEAGFYTWWDYRAGNFHKNLGMRIDHLYAIPLRRRPGDRRRTGSRRAQGQAAVRPRPAVCRPGWLRSARVARIRALMTEPRDDPAPDLEQALSAYLDAQRMTRRQLLERIAAVGAAAALAPVIAACAAGPADRAAAASRAGAGAAAQPAAAAAPVVPAVVAAPEAAALPAAPVQAAAASSHVIARIIARLVSRG